LVLPLSVPAVASLCIFQFVYIWNDLLIGRIFGGSKNLPIIAKLVEVSGSRGQSWHLLTAAAFVSMVAPLIVFFSLQRYFVAAYSPAPSRASSSTSIRSVERRDLSALVTSQTQVLAGMVVVVASGWEARMMVRPATSAFRQLERLLAHVGDDQGARRARRPGTPVGRRRPTRGHRTAAGRWREQCAVPRQHRVGIGSLALDGMLAPIGGLWQPRLTGPGEKPKLVDGSLVHGNGTRHPSRPSCSPLVRMNNGSSRAASGMSRYSARPISSPWYMYNAPGSAAGQA
jgi:hypothetical protein